MLQFGSLWPRNRLVLTRPWEDYVFTVTWKIFRYFIKKFPNTAQSLFSNRGNLLFSFSWIAPKCKEFSNVPILISLHTALTVHVLRKQKCWHLHIPSALVFFTYQKSSILSLPHTMRDLKVALFYTISSNTGFLQYNLFISDCIALS